MKCLSSLSREEEGGEKAQQGTFTVETAHGWHILASRAGHITSDTRRDSERQQRDGVDN